MKSRVLVAFVIIFLQCIIGLSCDNKILNLPGNDMPSDEEAELVLQGEIYIEEGEDGYYISRVNEDELDSSDVVIKERYIDGKPVVGINNLAFFRTGITSITIPTTVKMIGYAAFYYCTSLVSLVIKSEEISIGETAFSITGIQKVVIKNKRTLIDKGAFGWNHFLTNVVIESDEVSIDHSAFALCDSLEDVIIKGDVEYIGMLCYRIDELRVTNVTIFGNIKVVGDGAFWFYNSVFISGTVGEIGGSAFYGCNVIGNTVRLADGITTEIGDWAFCESSLIVITIPESVTTIGEGTFWGV